MTVTNTPWDHTRLVGPAAQAPEVWFRPLRSSLVNGLMTDKAVKGTLNPATGAGEVQLESAPDLMYVPEMRWLLDRSVPDAHDYCEWDAVHPGNGGPIHALPGVVKLNGIWYGFGAPPQQIKNRNDAIYLDITGPGVGIWVPERASFIEGVVV